jgi:HTH-type transcriptional regulator/antitoxin HigA
MITNDRQYKITKSKVEKFQLDLEDLATSINSAKEVHPKILEAQKNAIRYQLNQLLSDVREYEDLKEGRTIITTIKDLKDLPVALIKARIANNLTQSELAYKLGMKEQQIQRYEADKYEAASLKTLLRIAEILNIRIEGDIQLKEIESPDLLNCKNYPFKQMIQRKWFPHFTGSLNDAVKKSAELLSHLFENAGIQNLQTGFTKRSVRLAATFNEFALDAWYARVVIKAREQILDNYFDKAMVTDVWLHSLASLSIQIDGPLQAVNFLRDSGIRVVIEQHLEGTHLDGAALLLDDIYPVIALTLRHDRLDNFWFVLFHEIAHVYLHLGINYQMIFDDLDTVTDGIEFEADQFALNAMIPDIVWKKSLVRFSPSPETIINQAKTLKVHAALIAGRIRKETGKYYQFSDLVGQGEVRKFFAEELNN